jgi:hypothetical protein
MRRLFVLVAGCGLLACSAPKKEVPLRDALPNLPLPPSAQVLSREAGEDAMQVRFRSDLEPDQVAIYYRALLGKPPWRLTSDTPGADGTITLYAEQDGPSLWVTIRKAEGAPGSLVVLAGARDKK